MSSQSRRKLRHTRSLLLLIFALSFVGGVGGCTTKPRGQDGEMSTRRTIKVGMWGSPREIKMFDELTAKRPQRGNADEKDIKAARQAGRP